jgi:hypothetical protein
MFIFWEKKRVKDKWMVACVSALRTAKTENHKNCVTLQRKCNPQKTNGMMYQNENKGIINPDNKVRRIANPQGRVMDKITGQ